MTYNKDYYISEISNRSSRYGDKLIELMDRFHRRNLAEITLDEARDYYELLVEQEHDYD